MCGICGIVDYSGSSIEGDTLWQMTETLKHRGPDDSGVELFENVGLGHRRLSIIDLTSAGHQPMLSEDGNFALVYNGELYNFQELRRRLEGDGVVFRSRSDTEVVLKAYIRWGTNSFSMFKGMFALAVWDKTAQRLHMARDRFGIKPLYYYPFKSGVVFGSEIKSLIPSKRVRLEVDWQGLHEFLYYQNALGSNTLFDKVANLLPGQYLTVDRKGINVSSYWSLSDIKPISDSFEDATSTVRDRLEDAVKSHLVSDVPVGIFLSGGVDSSAVTAFAARHYCGKIKTFSVGFDFDAGVNELPKARQVAEHFGTEHEELHIQGSKVSDIIERLVRSHDQPFSDAANIPLYLLCQQLEGSIKVVLQGDGGDEIFAGYRRYNVLSCERFWRCFSRMAPYLGWVAPRSQSYYRRMRFFSAMRQSDRAMRMALLLTSESCNRSPTRVFTAEIRKSLSRFDPFARYREIYEKVKDFDPVQQMLYTDSVILLPDTFLEKVDKATMAHGIESRVPFLDADLTTYAMGLPSFYKVKRGHKKWILRQALRGIVPDTFLDARKTGFGVPRSYWLRGPLSDYMRSVLLDPDTLRWGVFDRKALEKCIDEHVHGLRDNALLLYKLLNLALWHRFYLS